MVSWRGRERSSNVEDRRGQGGGLGGGFGGGNNPFGQGGGGNFRVPMGRAGGGFGTIAIIVIVLIVCAVLGINPLSLLNGDTSGTTTTSSTTTTAGAPGCSADADDETAFVCVMLKDTEDFWGQYFQANGLGTYSDPKLVIFSRQTPTQGCGTADTASGPFYCPGDRQVYIDLDFYRQLKDDLGANGDFAQAYVIAHEVGHHVQDELGILGKFNQARQSVGQAEANHMSVQIELQADCFAGLWGHYEDQKGFLEPGDVEEALNAANQIGDDTLTRGQASPREYTHGTSAQRVQWFKTGFAATSINACDTSRV